MIVVLAFLVLMLIATLAFFSRAELNRRTGTASAAYVQSDLLFQSALGIIVSDLRQEIAAGSVADSFAATNPSVTCRIYEPITVNSTSTFSGATNIYLSTAPSMIMQRVVTSGSRSPANLAKQSLYGRPFFAITNGYASTPDLGAIANRASSASTTNAPLIGRAVSTNRWTMPRLAATNDILAPPDWIYVNRQGATPTEFSPTMSSKTKGNDQFVVGRFAYNIYDTGGLIDINVVGNSLGATTNAVRGYLHQASLAQAPAPLTVPAFADLIKWRAAGEPADITNSGGLFNAKRKFTTVPAGSQAFVTRQDLLNYSEQTPVIPPSALPYLTTFSRDLNAPSFAPEPNRPLLPADPPPAELNPALTSARFSAKTTLTRGSDADVTAEAGSPVMARRFPLSKLSLLSETNPDPATLKYYFGLQKNSDGTFDYTETIGGRIARLSEVANLQREPNFFEVLQAVITTGALGRHSGNSYTVDFPRDSLRNLQVIQIGANLIDQWDGDDFPTAIRFPDADGGWLSSFGIENLPYLNNFVMVPHRPVWERNRFQVWGLFDVWNPHRNASTPPKDISGFRIRATGGKGNVSLRYELGIRVAGVSKRPYTPLWKPTPESPPLIPTATGNQSILALNPASSSSLNFDAAADYSEPTVVGTGLPPANKDDRPGFLMWENPNIPAAIPAKASRTVDLQERLNTLMDNEFPYTAGQAFTKDPATGDRLYPAATTITGLNPTYWTQSTDATGQIRISANYPVKAHNWFRYTPVGPPDKTTFVLEYQGPDGQWHTYQVLNQFMPRDSGGEENTSVAGHLSGTPALPTTDIAPSFKSDPENWWKDTHHSVPGFDDKACFYGWRQPKNTLSFFKIDPRTTRFGYTVNQYADVLGTTIRTSPEPIPNVTTAAATTEAFARDPRWLLSTEWPPGSYDQAASPNPAFGPGSFSWLSLGGSVDRYVVSALMVNAPEGTLSIANQSLGRYVDLDGLTRPGDGYLGALPTVPGRLKERPVLLNRAFRSVGEMGYVFRDMPWKTVDFFSRNSGDLGLLDAFSLEESEDDVPVVAGKVNLNSASSQVIEALLLGTANHPDLPNEAITAAEAQSLGSAIRAAATSAPFRDRGNLVQRLLGVTNMNLTSVTTTAGFEGDLKRTKIQKEAAIRTLASIGTTRTWNLLIDIIVQTGRFPASSKDISAFAVRAERRYWVHLAIDRLTGKVVAKQEEIVNE